MFEKFTASARDTVVAAQVICRERRDPEITARHLALALLRQPGLAEVLAEHGVTTAALDRTEDAASLDAEALRSLGIDLDSVRRAAEASFGPGAMDGLRSAGRRRGWLRRGSGSPAHLPFSPGAKRTLELSLRESIRLKSRDIRPEHLALGLLGCDDPDLPDLSGVRERLGAALKERLRPAA